jgi:hypothetical protein
MPTDYQRRCPTAHVYETTEEARLLLQADGELSDASGAAGEAAYYLSDTIEPDQRSSLLAMAESCPRIAEEPDDDTEGRAAEALMLMSGVAVEVQAMLRGPSASSELRIALRALREAICNLAGFLGLEANETDTDMSGLQDERLRLFPRLRTGPADEHVL